MVVKEKRQFKGGRGEGKLEAKKKEKNQERQQNPASPAEAIAQHLPGTDTSPFQALSSGFWNQRPLCQLGSAALVLPGPLPASCPTLFPEGK